MLSDIHNSRVNQARPAEQSQQSKAKNGSSLKRQAPTIPVSPPAKCAKTTPTSTRPQQPQQQPILEPDSSSSPPPRLIGRRPQPNSINSLLQKNFKALRDALPSQWSQKHVDLIGCQFHAEVYDHDDERKTAQAHGEEDYWQEQARTWRLLLQGIKHRGRTRVTMGNLLSDLGFVRLPRLQMVRGKESGRRKWARAAGRITAGDEPDCLLFYLGCKPVDTLLVEAVHSDEAGGRPCLAWVDLARNATPPRDNKPDASKGSEMDPSILAVMIALAQAPAPATQDGRLPARRVAANAGDRDRRVHVLVTPSDPATDRHLDVYSASFTPIFLRRFDLPSNASPYPRLRVTRCRFPLDGGQAAIMGNADADGLYTWTCLRPLRLLLSSEDNVPRGCDQVAV